MLLIMIKMKVVTMIMLMIMAMLANTRSALFRTWVKCRCNPLPSPKSKYCCLLFMRTLKFRKMKMIYPITISKI